MANNEDRINKDISTLENLIGRIRDIDIPFSF